MQMVWKVLQPTHDALRSLQKEMQHQKEAKSALAVYPIIFYSLQWLLISSWLVLDLAKEDIESMEPAAKRQRVAAPKNAEELLQFKKDLVKEQLFCHISISWFCPWIICSKLRCCHVVVFRTRLQTWIALLRTTIQKLQGRHAMNVESGLLQNYDDSNGKLAG